MRTPPERGDNTLTVIALLLGVGVFLTLLLLFLTSLRDGPDAKISVETPSVPAGIGTATQGVLPLSPPLNDRAGDN